MSTPAPASPEQQVQEDLMRLDAYRSQFNSLAQQLQLLSASRQDHVRARESLEGIDRAAPGTEFLLPLGAEAFVRGSVGPDHQVLIGIGSGVLVEMERPKVAELLAQRVERIDLALRDLEGQMGGLDERIRLISRRLDAAAQREGSSPHVGRS
jgi:prefoldin alpha subunit